MTSINSKTGGVTFETLLALPPLLLVTLAAWQLTEITMAKSAVQWAAYLAARSAAVHLENPQDAATAVAWIVLGPFLPAPPASIQQNLNVPSLPNNAMAGAGLWLVQTWVYRNEEVPTLLGEDTPRVAATVKLFHKKQEVTKEEARDKVLQGGEDARGIVEATVALRYHLRVPGVQRFFADAPTESYRTLRASARFPWMYAHIPKEEHGAP